jgi:predicted methyltransferase
VDNGPTALAAEANHGLYDDSGVAAAHAALKPGGVLVVWSAGPDRAFERRLRRLGFIVTVDRVRARLKKGGARHVIFTAMKQARAHY